MDGLRFDRKSQTVDFPSQDGFDWHFSGVPVWVFDYLEKGKRTQLQKRILAEYGGSI